MSLTRNDGYAKTDFDFTTTRSVIHGVYCIFMFLVLLGAIGGIVCIASGNGGASVGLTALVSCIVSGLLLHVGYSFLVGYFELIKHAREIRNEPVALRVKSGASAPAPVSAAQPTATAGATRYDPATHQYVKA